MICAVYEGVEALFRNPMKEVLKFLEALHKVNSFESSSSHLGYNTILLWIELHFLLHSI
jgi:hypothetical protein